MLHKLIKFKRGRQRLIQDVNSEREEQWQFNDTPYSIVNKMLQMSVLTDRDILVMFNLEFLEELIFEYKIDASRIYFTADTEAEQMVADKLYGVHTTLIDKTLMTRVRNGESPLKERIFEMGKKHFDVVFSNPPYNGNIDLKILNKVVDIADELVIVHPSTWLIDLKGKSDLYNGFKDKISSRLKSVEMFNGNPVFNIGLFVPCVITHINGDNGGKIEVDNFGEKFEVSDISDITKFGTDWEGIVKPFMKKMKQAVAQNGSVWDNRIEARQEDSNKFYVQLAGIRGNVNMTTDTMKIVKDDFYTMVMENPEGNKGIRNPNVRVDGLLVWKFVTEIEQNNFLKYLQTDFARFALGITKNSQNNHYGEMDLIPWLDFTQEWDDAKLYTHFGIDEATQEYIRNFLPDFHGIRG